MKWWEEESSTDEWKIYQRDEMDEPTSMNKMQKQNHEPECAGADGEHTESRLGIEPWTICM